MPDLVALDLPGGPGFVVALRSVWEAGDAALPIDQRLPAPARRALLERLGPHAVIGPDGERTRHDRPGEPVEPGDALVVPTSGTSGDPRGVVLTHEAVAAHARGVHRMLDVDPAADRWLACLPLAHVGGLGVITRALVTGTPLDVLPGFDPAAVHVATSRGATLTSLVPTALDRLGPYGERFRRIVLGGSADPVDRPSNVVRTYGLTETGGGVVYDPGGPLPGTEVRVVDGEIELRGPTLLRAYRSGVDPKDATGWLRTGDLGEVDAAGRLRVFGRRGELVITGGENVWPEAVEAALRTHPAVADVGVGGRPDPEWGARVVAWVVPVDPAHPPDLDRLRAHVKETLPAFAAPRELVLVATLPRTALGKLRRSAL